MGASRCLPVKGESALKAQDVRALTHVHRGPNDSDLTETSKVKLSNSLVAGKARKAEMRSLSRPEPLPLSLDQAGNGPSA